MRSAFRVHLLIAALSLAPIANAVAKNCDIPKSGWRMDTKGKREKAIYESYFDVWDDEDQPRSKIYFVIPSENGRDSEVFSLEVRGGAALEMKADTLKRLSEAKELRIYNPTSHPSLYFVPFAANALKSFEPKQHCSDARESQRHAGKGCTTISMGKHEKMTMFYAEYADKCDKIADVQRNAKKRDGRMTTAEKELLAEAVSDMNDYFGIENGPNRRPSNLSSPQYADEKGDEKIDQQRKGTKKLPIVPAGKNKRQTPVKTKETRGAG